MKNGYARMKRLKSKSFRVLSAVCASAVAALAALIVIYVLANGLGGISWEFLTGKPSYIKGTIGILPDILNTVYIMICTLLVVLPLGVGAAIYLTEYAKNMRVKALIEFAAETLSGIPSIIYGLAGMLIFTRFFGLRTSLLVGALTLAVMNLPTVIRTSQESLKAVPNSYREGAFALGAGKWRAIRTLVLPSAASGVVTGCILTIGRILGESAALLYTAGFAHTVNGFIKGLSSPGASLTVAMYVYAKEDGRFDVAFSIAAILIIMALVLNLLAAKAGSMFVKDREE